MPVDGSDVPTAPIAAGELIRRGETGEIRILVARDELTMMRSWCAAGERVAGPHVHRSPTDSFYVLDGELTFEIGRERETIAVSSGGFVSVPPGVAHAIRNSGDLPARWLTIHTPDGGFAAFMRGIRDGVRVEWDMFEVPGDGGRPAGDAVVDPGRP